MNPMIQHLYNRVADFLVPTNFTSTWPAPRPNEMEVRPDEVVNARVFTHIPPAPEHIVVPSRANQEPKPPRCPFWVSDPHGLCEYCDQPEEVHDERARKGVA